MSNRFSRYRVGVAAGAAFIGGVFFASGMDWTKYSWAQTNATPTVAQPVVRGPNAPEAAGSFSAIAERATPAVVSIRTLREARPNARMRGRSPQGMDDFLRQFGQQPPRESRGEGSGFIITPDGYIVTNNHVVADADQVTVVLSDERQFKARVIGTDSTTDVAVVKIDGNNFSTLPIGNDETSRIGDWVLAVGNPLGLDFTVTAGIISAKGRGGREVQLPNAGGLAITDFIQTDAAINPGNSGGPLLNLKGEVIGLNSAIASETGYYSGYGFAIPVTLVKQVSDMLIKDGRVRLPVMGIQVAAVEAEDAGVNGLTRLQGVKVAGYNPSDGGPAKAAGIETGDIITTIDGTSIDRVSALQRVVRSHKIGDVVAVDVMRFGSKKTFRVKLVAAEEVAEVSQGRTSRDNAPEVRPVSSNSNKLGVGLETVTPELASQASQPGMKGVRVTEVASDGPANGKLVRNHIIQEVLFPTPRRAVTSVADLQSALGSVKDGDYISLRVLEIDGRGAGESRVINIRVGK